MANERSKKFMSEKRVNKNLFKVITPLLGILMMGGILSQFLAKNSRASQAVQSATVINIIDGDTLDVNMSGCRLPLNGNSQQCRIQLACIDTPEKDASPFFQQSKERLKALLPPGTTVRVRDTGSNTRDRVVAELFVNNKSVNLQMVREGKAVNYCRHLNSCAGSRSSYLSAENAAMREGLGVWNTNQPWTAMRESHPCSN